MQSAAKEKALSAKKSKVLEKKVQKLTVEPGVEAKLRKQQSRGKKRELTVEGGDENWESARGWGGREL